LTWRELLLLSAKEGLFLAGVGSSFLLPSSRKIFLFRALDGGREGGGGFIVSLVSLFLLSLLLYCLPPAKKLEKSDLILIEEAVDD